ncbi:hypothetical protein QEN19_003931 [Hanseniaspora menglaensis]
MMSNNFIFFICLFSSLLLHLLKANKDDEHLPIIEIFGNKFFNSVTKEQFFIKGIAYQPSLTAEELNVLTAEDTKFIDPLANENTCKRDIHLLKELGINVIRVYQIDVNLNHDFCMRELEKNGIYVILDLSEPGVSIIREKPAFTTQIFQRYIDVVDAMSRYNNTLGFFAGNEVTNDKTNTFASAFVKASVRDIKNYITGAVQIGKLPRAVPVGYATNDDPETRLDLMNYLICDSKDSEKIDFYGINIYEWCGYSSYYTSGYKERTEEYKDYPIPLFMSEFGCNTYRPRAFTEIQAIYSPLMTDVWSGGLVYMFFEEENQYGIVERISPTELKILPEFDTLKTQYNSVFATGISKEDYENQLTSKSKKTVTCPPISETWKARSDKLPPTPDFKKCEYLQQLPCSLKASLPTEEMYNIAFSYLCNKIVCSEISSNNEYYGKYSDCSRNEQLSYLMSKLYYKSNDNERCPLEEIIPGYIEKNSDFSHNNNILSNDYCYAIDTDTKSKSSKKQIEMVGEYKNDSKQYQDNQSFLSNKSTKSFPNKIKESSALGSIPTSFKLAIVVTTIAIFLQLIY